MPHNNMLQEQFLQELFREKMSVSIFLVNGIKLHGMIAGFDEHVVLLKNAITQMIYKNAISTIVPAKGVNINTGD